MHNSFIPSTIAFRTKSSLSYSSHDYYLLNNHRVNRTQSCTCCAFPTPGVPLNPRFCFKSTWFHCLTPKRLILSGKDQFLRQPLCNFDSLNNAKCCSVRESCQCSCSTRRRGNECRKRYCDSNVDQVCCGNSCNRRDNFSCCNTNGRVRKQRRLKCLIWEDTSESDDLGVGGNIEEMLDLLTVDKKSVGGGRKRNDWLSDGRVQVERRTMDDDREREKYAKAGYGQRKSRGRVESVVTSKEEECRFCGRRDDQNNRLIKDGSNSSSYYSVLSSDEVDKSDMDEQVNHGKLSGVSLSRNKKELKKFDNDISVKNVIKQSTNSNYDATASTSAAVGSDHRSRNERENKFTDIREESQLESSNVMDSRRRDSGTRFTSQNRLSDRQDISGLATYSIDETRSQVSQQDGSRRDSQQLTERSQIRNNDIKQMSSSQARFREREETSAASMNVFEEKEERHSQTSQSTAELRRKSQNLSGRSESRDNRIRNTSISQTRFESALKNREDSSTSSFQEAEKKEMHSDQHLREIKITEEDQNLSNISVISGNDTAITNPSQKVIERRTHPEEEISASYVSQISSNHDSRTSTSQRLSKSVLKNREESSTSLLSSLSEPEERNQTAERVVWGTEGRGETQQATYPIKQLGSRTQSERLTETSILQEGSANWTSRSQSSDLHKQKTEQQMDEQMEVGRTLQVMVTPPPSQILHRTSSETVIHQRPNAGNTTDVVYFETPGSGSGTIYTEEITPSSSNDYIGQTSMDNNNRSHSNVMLHEDALGSANRLEESSTQFFRQFVEKLSQEASTSEFPEGNISSEPSSSNKDAEDTQHTLNQRVPDDVHSQVHDSRKSSSRSGAKGPSDEVWDIVGPYSEKPARDEDTSEVSSSTNTAIARPSRSLWGIIGDIVRLRWGARSETRTSSTKSRGKSSSNQSVGSEAWFSSHEADEKSDENVKKGKKIMPKLHRNSDKPLKAEAESLGGALEGTSADNTVLVTEADRFASLDIVKGSSASTTSKVESQRLEDKSNQGISSSASIPSASSPLPSKHFMRSPAVRGEVPESSEAMSSRSESGQMEQLLQKRPTEGSGTEMKDGELKQRKLQRNKQVEKETFEDWEEAYRLEREQRIIDEMFMKEALLEAKRAADTWEVPVGAVLVQHGKIIARGCNLVEDLRDSTAHAEMICIREASKTLQTWRLAETTLYVTLEPCAMCAGAILQSRIDTVVWGAPNKLLGADGSWVRLFPGGSDTGGSSDLTSQLGGPVHPFHPKITLRRGILAPECADVMQQFFQLRRKKVKKSESPPPSSRTRILTHPSKFVSKMHHIFNVMFCL
ncbi:tRNA(adenine(34)) deaminase [Ranunculus cassubicifolius]